MRIFDRVMGRLGYAKQRAKVQLPRHLRVVAEQSRWNMTDYSLYGNQAKTYALCSWVYICISRIAEAAALVPFKVMRRGEAEELQEVPNHPFEPLLRRPNDKFSQLELLESTFGFLELTGNAYWYLNVVDDGAGRGGGVPVEIWPLRPDRVEIVPSDRQWIQGYVYHVNGAEVPLGRDEVVHFKRWHPLADYEGLSAIEAAGYVVEGDLQAQKWNVNFFKNNAVPSAIVGIKEHVSDADYDALVAQWAGQYKGVERAHKAAFIRGSDVTVTPLGLNPRDMEFLQLRRFNKEETFLLFGIPLGKYSENATQANANVAERTFLNETLWPKLCRVAQKITAEVLPRYGEDLVGQFEDVRWVSDEQKLKELRVVAQYGLMSLDEIRARYWQMQPLETGEVSREEYEIAGVDGGGRQEARGVVWEFGEDGRGAAGPLTVRVGRDGEGG